MKTHKVMLGTAQFGMDYGINNKRGRVPADAAHKILNKAISFGIDTFDTAAEYGESERVLGIFIKSCPGKLKIISKLSRCEVAEVENNFYASMERLNTSMLHGYLIHNFQHYIEKPQIWGALEKLKREGKVEKIGFSLYFPYELENILEKEMKIDIVQVPFSIFDQRFLPYFPGLRQKGIEVHVRSVFLQGLVFKKPDTLGHQFIKIKEKLNQFYLLSEKSGFSIGALCLNFAVLNEFVNKVAVGVDSLNNLEEIISALSDSSRVNKDIMHKLSEFREDDEKVILPINWDLAGISA